MKGAVASVELFARRDGDDVRRLTLTIAAPERSASGAGWSCRVALADLHRPITLERADSVSALGAAFDQARAWVAALEADGLVVTRDRGGSTRFQW